MAREGGIPVSPLQPDLRLLTMLGLCCILGLETETAYAQPSCASLWQAVCEAQQRSVCGLAVRNGCFSLDVGQHIRLAEVVSVTVTGTTLPQALPPSLVSLREALCPCSPRSALEKPRAYLLVQSWPLRLRLAPQRLFGL